MICVCPYFHPRRSKLYPAWLSLTVRGEYSPSWFILMGYLCWVFSWNQCWNKRTRSSFFTIHSKIIKTHLIHPHSHYRYNLTHYSCLIFENLLPQFIHREPFLLIFINLQQHRCRRRPLVKTKVLILLFRHYIFVVFRINMMPQDIFTSFSFVCLVFVRTVQWYVYDEWEKERLPPESRSLRPFWSFWVGLLLILVQ